MKLILSESKLGQRITLEEKEDSADVWKRNDDRPIFAEIASNKDITDIRKFKKKRSKTHAEFICYLFIVIY